LQLQLLRGEDWSSAGRTGIVPELYLVKRQLVLTLSLERASINPENFKSLTIMRNFIVLVQWAIVRLLFGGLVKALSFAPITTFHRIRVNSITSKRVTSPSPRVETIIRHRPVRGQDTRVQAAEGDEEGVTVTNKKTGRYPSEFMTVPDGSKIAYTQLYKEGANEIVICT
jgi:hypothetical protein